MTNNTKPIIDDTHFACPEMMAKMGLNRSQTVCCGCTGHKCQKNLSTKSSTNDKQLSDLGCGRHPIGEQCECVGYAVTEATTWEERFDKTYNKERFDEIGFVFEDFEHVKLFLKSEIATAVQEERKLHSKCKGRFEIVRNRMQACEEDHPNTHKVSLIEIPGWIDEITDKE